MIKEKDFMQVRNVNNEAKAKAMFILKCKGKTLSQEIRDMIDRYAEEFDKKNSK
jgi:hypothetical protein